MRSFIEKNHEKRKYFDENIRESLFVQFFVFLSAILASTPSSSIENCNNNEKTTEDIENGVQENEGKLRTTQKIW